MPISFPPTRLLANSQLNKVLRHSGFAVGPQRKSCPARFSSYLWKIRMALNEALEDAEYGVVLSEMAVTRWRSWTNKGTTFAGSSQMLIWARVQTAGRLALVIDHGNPVST